MNYLKKTAVATAIAGALGAGASVAGDGVWFPYVSKGDTFTTIISVINRSGTLYDGRGNPGVGSSYNRMHWVLSYKDGAQFNDNMAPCKHFDDYLPTSKDDLQTVDIGGVFGDDSNTLFDDNVPGTSGDSFHMTRAANEPVRGHLLVLNADSTSVTGATGSSRATVTGEMLNLDYSLGAAVGDQGVVLDHIGDHTNGYNGLGPFNIVLANSVYDAEFFPIFSHIDLVQRVPFMPWDEVATNLLVTPIASMVLGDNPPVTTTFPYGSMFIDGAQNNWAITLKLGIDNNVAFDRNERAKSGTKPQTVVCVGKVNMKSFFEGNIADTDFPEGGWSHLKADMTSSAKKDSNGTPIRQSRGAHIYKHEMNLGGTLSGMNSGPGTWNNMLKLQPWHGYFEFEIIPTLQANGIIE